MKSIYEKYKGKEIKNNLYSGIVVGYNEDKLILAVEGNPVPSFKKLDKDAYVEDYYRADNNRFCYSDERSIEKYLGITGVYEEGRVA